MRAATPLWILPRSLVRKRHARTQQQADRVQLRGQSWLGAVVYTCSDSPSLPQAVSSSRFMFPTSWCPFGRMGFPREYMKSVVSLNTKFYPVFIPPREHLVSPVSSRAPAELNTVFGVKSVAGSSEHLSALLEGLGRARLLRGAPWAPSKELSHL